MSSQIQLLSASSSSSRVKPVFPSPSQGRQTQVSLDKPGPVAEIVLLLIGLGLLGAGGFWFWMVHEEGFLLAYVFPALFSVVGLGLSGIGVAGLLARSKVAPPDLVVSAQPLFLGEQFTVLVRQPFKAACQLESLTLTLLCEEVARYRRGTSTYTDRKTVLEEKQELFSAQAVQGGDVLEEEAVFHIPEDAMHSFHAQWNEIQWKLKVHTSIAGWPDFRAEYSLQVAPGRVQA